MSRVRTLIAAIVVAGLHTGSAIGQSSAPSIWPGFVIRAEDRFDPVIQRLMADHALRLMPLERGQLYYVYPIGMAPRLEGAQIRYLESLLDKRSQEEAAGEKREAGNGSDMER
jgi:hypothetical protein